MCVCVVAVCVHSEIFLRYARGTIGYKIKGRASLRRLVTLSVGWVDGSPSPLPLPSTVGCLCPPARLPTQ